MDTLLGQLALGASGLLLWMKWVRDDLPGTPENRDTRGLLGLFGLGFLIAMFFTQMFLQNTIAATPDEPPTVVQSMSALSAGSAVAVLALLFFARRLPDGRAALGMVAQERGSPVLAALCAYLIALPVIALLSVINFEIAPLYLGDAADEQLLQDLMRDFIEQGASSSVVVWMAMGVVIPFAEELLYRGALYGGLRQRVGPLRAAFLSALIFSLLHGNPAHILPLMGLGVILAWIYERTGSLAAPALVHILNNMVTLALNAGLGPEDLS